MERFRVFAPGNISCVFKVIPHEDPARMHSLGMGFTVKEGVTVTVFPDDRTTVLFNRQEVPFLTVVSAVQKLTPQSMRVELESPLPLGCGFGLSGASSLATAYALNAQMDLGRSDQELAMIAHVSEVENLTGLGDVCAQYHGGCLVKLTEGQPLAARSLAVREQPIYYRYFTPINTAEVLRDAEQKARINKAAEVALRRLSELVQFEHVDFNACIRISKDFSVESGLLRDPKVQEIIAKVEEQKGFASMIMLGNAVFSTSPFEGALETMLSHQGARVL
jgi:pantoate kinase